MPTVRHLDVVLKPLSRPELGEIRIGDSLFAIGRTEPPFASYGNSVVNMLSRRHAYIFRKGGLVYLADLESRNGTFVNGVPLKERALEHADEIQIGSSVLVFQAHWVEVSSATPGYTATTWVMSCTGLMCLTLDNVQSKP